MKTNFFRYSGTKFNYAEDINLVLNQSNKKYYIEPFAGSGAILFNLTKKFEKYYINDIDRNITRIYESFKDPLNTYDYYKSKISFVLKTFGNIIEKQNYYNFRDWFNKNHWNSNTLDEGIYLHMLANSCINSMFRFGPNGMNQSFGNRHYILDSRNFKSVKDRLYDTVIMNGQYDDVLNSIGDNIIKNSFLFLDPPYFSQGSSYQGFNVQDTEKFISFIKKADFDFIYTDIINEYNENISDKIHKHFFRSINNTAPTSDKQSRGNLEYMFTNLNVQILEKPEIDEDEW